MPPEQKPNPGSPEAIAIGCLCPVSDNAKGEGFPYGGEQCFWVNGDCPIHGKDKLSIDMDGTLSNG